MKSLQELFEHELKDIYYAEHKLIEALDEMAGESTDKEIKNAFQTHKKETQEQIKRLDKVFEALGQKAEAEPCPGIEGLIKEKKQFSKEKPTEQLLDLYNVGAAQKSERYEITAYESLIEIAQKLSLGDALPLLEQNLQEEQATLEKLKTISKEYDMESLLASA